MQFCICYFYLQLDGQVAISCYGKNKMPLIFALGQSDSNNRWLVKWRWDDCEIKSVTRGSLQSGQR